MSSFFVRWQGKVQGPLDLAKLKNLAATGKLKPEMELSKDKAKWYRAGSVKGLFQQPKEEGDFLGAGSDDVPTSNASTFCRNCGKAVHEKAMACPACGVPPFLEKKFCPSCGARTSSSQAVCTKCGCSITRSKGGGSGKPGDKTKIAAGLFAIFLGIFGVHKFYLGSLLSKINLA